MLNRTIHPSWNVFLTDEIRNEISKIETEINKTGYFPEKKNILRFMENDLNNVKVIIVGMEPYPSYYEDNKPEATGRSFEVASVKDWNQKFKQSSLRNILKTVYFNETGRNEKLEVIRKEIQDGSFSISSPEKWFDNLEKQGVLFLNATLTVIPENVDTHTALWEKFINELILYIEEKNQNVIWFLWGQKAQDRILPFIKEEKAVCCHHPRLTEFVTENCFGKVKDIVWKI